jgi:hypothetical protein
MAVAAAAGPAPADKGTLSKRVRQYALSFGMTLGLKTMRASLYTLVPILASDIGISAAHRAMLMSAFFPGYALSQVPGSVVVQLIGSKVVLSASLGISALLFSLAPTIIQLPTQHAPTLLAAALFAMGLVQGPMAPASSQLNRAWMPTGHERVWAYRFLGLAHQLTNVVGAGLTPLLCRSRGGWQACCYVYSATAAALTVLWQCFARDRPKPIRAGRQGGLVGSDGSGGPSTGAGTTTAAVHVAPQKQKKVEPGIFQVRAAQVTVANFIAYGQLNYSMMMFSPILYVEKLGCSPAVAGAYIATASSLNIPGQFLVGCLESMLINAGVGTLTIRRWSTGAGGA